jgi:hypothetical protein
VERRFASRFERDAALLRFFARTPASYRDRRSRAIERSCPLRTLSIRGPKERRIHGLMVASARRRLTELNANDSLHGQRLALERAAGARRHACAAARTFAARITLYVH